MSRWCITIETWPFSTGAGQSEDQKAAGERVTTHFVEALEIAEALDKAKLIAAGIKHNPRVWEAPITGITKDG
ncbi:hypothetical protein [Roseococcus sp.]|uniref:hypothetical protein n=1 Tax=Roseococcus sp. TaxID=2109646 RepID=UPI003BAA5113